MRVIFKLFVLCGGQIFILFKFYYLFGCYLFHEFAFILFILIYSMSPCCHMLCVLLLLLLFFYKKDIKPTIKKNGFVAFWKKIWICSVLRKNK